MDTSFSKAPLPSVTDVYTDLSGLQGLKNENDEAALKKVAQQFESMFISLLLKNVRSANEVFGEGGLFDNQESKFYQDMHDNQLALSLAHGRGFGIADAMYRQLSRSHGDASGANALRASQAPSVTLEANAKPEKTNVANAVENVVDRDQIASSPFDFVRQIYRDAKQAAKEMGVEAEVLIAQAALETGWGRHVFTKKSGESSFNLFNIKADSAWEGGAISKASLEFLDGQFSRVASKFRAYNSVSESFDDFAKFIQGNARYQGATTDLNSPMDFIKNIHSAGYATDPNYVEKIESVYKRVKSLISSEEMRESLQENLKTNLTESALDLSRNLLNKNSGLGYE